jgi:hypothetical protein
MTSKKGIIGSIVTVRHAGDEHVKDGPDSSKRGRIPFSCTGNNCVSTQSRCSPIITKLLV